MTEHTNESFLPRVEDIDLAYILFDDIADPTHAARWQHLVETNPTLARELLVRAHQSVNDITTSIEGNKKVDALKRMVDEITFAISALEAAAKRKRLT